MKQLSRLILKLFGWKVTGSMPPEVKKAVIVAAPHTSNMDFIIGRLAFSSIGLHVKFMIKKEVFFWPLGGILKALGGIPVDRSKRTNLVDQLAEQYRQRESMFIVVTPEGTRKRVTHWKKGFYYIAKKAEIPVALCFIDYKEKQGGIGPIIELTDDFHHDLRRIQEFYADKHAKYPEKFNLTELH